MFLTEDLTENKKKKETKQNVLTSIINLIRNDFSLEIKSS